MTTELKQIARAVAFASALVATGSAFAATDGDLDATESVGEVGVRVAIEDRVQISNLDDIDFGTYTGTGTLSETEAFCVYRNGTGAYDIEIGSAQGDGTDFQVSDGATGTAVYTVKFDDDTDASDAGDITDGAVLENLVGDAGSVSCADTGGENASIQLSFTEAELQAMATGTWTDTITLTVTPN